MVWSLVQFRPMMPPVRPQELSVSKSALGMKTEELSGPSSSSPPGFSGRPSPFAPWTMAMLILPRAPSSITVSVAKRFDCEVFAWAITLMVASPLPLSVSVVTQASSTDMCQPSESVVSSKLRVSPSPAKASASGLAANLRICSSLRLQEREKARIKARSAKICLFIIISFSARTCRR